MKWGVGPRFEIESQIFIIEQKLLKPFSLNEIFHFFRLPSSHANYRKKIKLKMFAQTGIGEGIGHTYHCIENFWLIRKPSNELPRKF